MGAKLDAIGMLARFVPFDTIGARVNHDCIDFVRQFLAAHGRESRITPDPAGIRSACQAVITPGVPRGAETGVFARAAFRRFLGPPGARLAA